MNSKKNLIARLAVAGVVAVVAGAAMADQDCSLRTLSGTYVFAASGWGSPGGSWVPKAIVEVLRFNGDGTLTSPGATVANRAGDGQVVASPPNGTGQYTLGADCMGTLSFHDGPSFNIVASAKGDDLWMIQTNPHNVLEGQVTRIDR